MKSKWHRLLIVLMGILLSIYLPTENRIGLAQDNSVRGTIKSNTMLREGPGANYNPITEIQADAQIEVLNRDTTANWIYVQVLNSPEIGWLPVSFVEFSDNFDVNTLPNAETSKDTPSDSSFENTSTYKTAIDSLPRTDITLYAEPNLNAENLPLSEEIEEVTILQRTQSGAWLEIQIDEDTQGWVVLTVFELDEDFVDIWDNLPRQESMILDVFEPIFIDPLNLMYIDSKITTIFARLNFRNGPGTTFAELTTLPLYTEVEVLAVDNSEFWLLVNVAGQEGWIFRQYVNDYVLTFDPNSNEDGTTNSFPPSAGYTYYPIGLRTAPGNEVDNDLDGRLNPFLHRATGLIYCFDTDGYTDRGNMNGGGIAVYLFYAEQQGVVLVASESLIASIGVPENTTLIQAESGFELYRLPNGLFQMNGPQIDGGTFYFQWEGCQPNFRTESL